MLTVFFADDEQVIRDGLKVILDWEALGFTICGDAANGEDALKRILELQPSLCILDIRMPKIHGLEVIQALREKKYTGKIIILSGYSDFMYAQQAIRYGVNYYLTKPIDEDELQRIVIEISEEISQEQQNTKVNSHYRVKAKREILEDLVLGTADVSLIDTQEMNLTADLFQIVIYEQYMRDIDELPYQFADLLRVTNNGSFTFEHFLLDDKNVIILKGQYALDKFQRFLEHYHTTPPQKDSPLDTLFLAYGDVVHSLADLHVSYAQAKKLLSRRFFCDPGQHTLGFEELPNLISTAEKIDLNRLDTFCKTLCDYVQAFNRKMIASTLEEMRLYLYNVQNNPQEIKLFLTDLFLRIKESMNHTYTTASIPFRANAEIIALIDSKFYLYQIIEFISNELEMVMSSIGTSTRDSILDDILYYIDHNYQNNIKLENIAPLFGYNSAYLGKIFSKTVGENFNNYVDHIRISAAKTLIMENNYKVYEIAEQVGYKNVDYFHKKFKKYVGMSPAEYRKAMFAEQGLVDDGTFED